MSRIEKLAPAHKQRRGDKPLRIIAMIENARGMVEIEAIAKAGGGYLDGLLVSTRPSEISLVASSDR